MPTEHPISLKEVQLRLGVPQHVLIHLCEKGVIEPDFAETTGRGKRREFSRRNLFEFGVALALRRLGLPVAKAALIVRLLRTLSRATGKVMRLPEGLLHSEVELRLYFYPDEVLVVSGRGGALPRPVLLAAKLGGGERSLSTSPRLKTLDELPKGYEGRLELDLSTIARNTLKSNLSK